LILMFSLVNPNAPGLKGYCLIGIIITPTSVTPH